MRKSLKITKDLTNKIGILIHVPKTAGRSFQKTFIGKGVLRLIKVDYIEWLFLCGVKREECASVALG